MRTWAAAHVDGAAAAAAVAAPAEVDSAVAATVAAARAPDSEPVGGLAAVISLRLSTSSAIATSGEKRLGALRVGGGGRMAQVQDIVCGLSLSDALDATSARCTTREAMQQQHKWWRVLLAASRELWLLHHAKRPPQGTVLFKLAATVLLMFHDPPFPQ